MNDPEDGLLGLGTQWGAPDKSTPHTTESTDDGSHELARGLPACLLAIQMSLRLDGIKGQTGDIEQRAQQKRLTLGLNTATYDDLCDRLRDVSDNTLMQHPTYYRAIVLELESRQDRVFGIPVPGLDNKPGEATLRISLVDDTGSGPNLKAT